MNFNGTGTVAIRASGNVSSITDNGTGDYTVNFTTAMPDANYAMSFGSRVGSGVYGSLQVTFSQQPTATNSTPTTTSVRINSVVQGATNGTDGDYILLQFIR